MYSILQKDEGGKCERIPGEIKRGFKTEITFDQAAYGQEILVEAFVYGAEKKAPPGLVVIPQRGKPEITKAEILGLDGQPLKEKPRYNEKILLKVSTKNMQRLSVNLKVYEEDKCKNDLILNYL